SRAPHCSARHAATQAARSMPRMMAVGPDTMAVRAASASRQGQLVAPPAAESAAQVFATMAFVQAPLTSAAQHPIAVRTPTVVQTTGSTADFRLSSALTSERHVPPTPIVARILAPPGLAPRSRILRELAKSSGKPALLPRIVVPRTAKAESAFAPTAVRRTATSV